MWLLICLESYSLFFWDLFLEKHRLLLGINKIDHVCCSSLERRKEDSQRCQLGHCFSSICHVEVSDKEKNCSGRTSKELSYSPFCSSCKGNEYTIHMMGWRTQLFTHTMGC